MKRFCPKCGKDIDDKTSIDNFCIDCYLKDHELVKLPDLDVTYCVKCHKIRYGHKWYNNFEEVKNAILKNVKILSLKQAKVDLDFDLNFESNKYKAFFKIKALLGNKFKEIVKEKEIKLQKDTCLTCSRIAGNYYTTIIQLRFKTKKLMELIEGKILTEIETIMDNINEKTNKISATIHIVREEKQKTGTDLYIDNLKLSYNLVQHLMKHKTAREYKTSKTLVGVSRDGQRVYRTTFCVHFEDPNDN